MPVSSKLDRNSQLELESFPTPLCAALDYKRTALLATGLWPLRFLQPHLQSFRRVAQLLSMSSLTPITVSQSSLDLKFAYDDSSGLHPTTIYLFFWRSDQAELSETSVLLPTQIVEELSPAGLVAVPQVPLPRV